MLLPGIGAIVGAIAGVAGAIFGASQERKKERAEAQAQLKTQNAAVTQILQVGAGKGVGEFQKQFMEFEDAGNKLQSLARKAGDPRASDIGRAIDNTFAILNREFLGRFEGFNQALRDGLAADERLRMAIGKIVPIDLVETIIGPDGPIPASALASLINCPIAPELFKADIT